jgi:hypothetical protein
MPKSYLQRVLNKCRCGKPCECLVLGTLDKANKVKSVKVIGYDCKHCGIQKEADIKELDNF